MPHLGHMMFAGVLALLFMAMTLLMVCCVASFNQLVIPMHV